MNNSKATIEDFREVGIWKSSETNLPVSVLVLSRGPENLPARMYISNIPGDFCEENCFGMTINDNPLIIGKNRLKEADMEMVVDWMFLNWEHLLNIYSATEDAMNFDDVIDGFSKL